MTVTLNRNKIRTNFRINEELIKNVNSYKYLRVYINSKMRWNETVDHMASKAKALSLSNRSFSACSSRIKEKLYLSVSFVLSSSTLTKFWSPSSKELKQRLEMVQRNAARFVTNNYSQSSSVTDMLGHLNWETVESRRTQLKLKLLHKMFACQVTLKLFDYFQINNCRNLHNSHFKKLMPKFARVDAVKHSFFYRVIPKWNSLPDHEVSGVATEDLGGPHFCQDGARDFLKIEESIGVERG